MKEAKNAGNTQQVCAGNKERYMFKNKWTEEHTQLLNSNLISYEPVKILEIENGIILPAKAVGYIYDAGGLLDSDGNFVEESRNSGCGGAYPYRKEDVTYHDETVIFIPAIPKQWGHMLIDFICRLWFLDDEEYRDYKILCDMSNFKHEPFSGNYLELLRLLGIEKGRIEYLLGVSSYKKVYLPERTWYWGTANSRYKAIIDKIVSAVNQMAEEGQINFTPYERIYFSRVAFVKNGRETGEKEIEENFAINGFQILYPEKLSAIEQIYYVNHCKELVSMSGTPAHNAVFAGKETHLTVLNRNCFINPPQYVVEQLFKCNTTFVDVYDKWTLINPNVNALTTVGIEENRNLFQYLRDNNYQCVKRTWKEKREIKRVHRDSVHVKRKKAYLWLCVLNPYKKIIKRLITSFIGKEKYETMRNNVFNH